MRRGGLPYEGVFWVVVLSVLALMVALRLPANVRNLVAASVIVLTAIAGAFHEIWHRPAFWGYFSLCAIGQSLAVWVILQSVRDKIPMALIAVGMLAEGLVLLMGLWIRLKPKG